MPKGCYNAAHVFINRLNRMIKMKKMPFLWLLRLMLVGSLALTVHANPYQADVALSGESDEQESAIRAAFVKVLIKASGNRQIHQDIELSPLLPQARSYVSEFVYLEPGENQTQRWMRVSFQAASIQALLSQLQQPIWLQRPKILVLAALEQDLVNADTQVALSQAIAWAAESRGLPVLLPLWDLTEQRQTSLRQIRQFSEGQLQSLRKRYGADAYVVARLTQLSSGLCLAKWQMKYKDRELDFIQDQRAECAVLLRRGIDRVSDWLAQSQAIKAGTQAQEYVQVQVDGVDSYQDYADLMHYLKYSKVNILLASVKLSGAEGNSLRLGWGLQGSKDELLKLLQQDGKLMQVQPVQSLKSDFHFQWHSP